MEEYIALSHIFKLSTELAKDPALFYRMGYLFGYRGEELILILLFFKVLGVKIKLLHTFLFALFVQPTIHQDHLSVHLVSIHYG